MSSCILFNNLYLLVSRVFLPFSFFTHIHLFSRLSRENNDEFSFNMLPNYLIINSLLFDHVRCTYIFSHTFIMILSYLVKNSIFISATVVCIFSFLLNAYHSQIHTSLPTDIHAHIIYPIHNTR